MPKVTSVQGMIPQSTIKPLSAPEMPRTPSLAAFGGGGQGMAAFGNGLEKLAGAMGNIAQANAESDAREADTAFAKDVREVMLNPDGGFMTRKGSDAVGAAGSVDEYISERRKYYAENLDSLARQKFDQWADRRMEVNGNAIANHTMREQQTVNMGNAKARVESLLTDATMNYFNPRLSNEYLAAAEEEVLNLATMQGYGDDQISLARAELHSSYARNILEDVAKTRTKDFDSYHRQLSGMLRGNDASQIDHLKRGIEQKNTINTATATLLQNAETQHLTQPFASPDELKQAQMMAESSGNPKAISRDKNGNPVAYGLYQFTEQTGREWHGKMKAAGKVDGEFSVERLLDSKYSETLRDGYMEYLLNRYDGDQYKAVQAYHMGFGDVDKGVPQGPENRKYLSNVFGNRLTTKPTGEADMANMAQSLTGGDIVMTKAVMANYSFITDAREKQQKESQKAVVNQWSLHIVKGGSFNDIDPVSLSAMGDDGQRKMLELWEKRQSIQGRADGENQYKALIGLLAQNPDEFANTDLLTVAPNLTESQLKSMLKEQEKINTGGYVESAADKSAKDWIKGNGDLLRGADIDPTSNKDSKKKERDLFRGRLITEISTFMDANNKRKPNPKELNQIASTLLEETNKSWFGSDKIYEVDKDSLSAAGLSMAETILDLSGQSSLRSTFGAQQHALDSLQNARKITQDITGKPLSNNDAPAAAAALMVMPREQFEAAIKAGADPQDILEQYRSMNR